MSPRNGTTMVAIVMIILLMAGTVGMFILMQALSSSHPDPHDVSHEYEFIGTLDGKECSGTGKSTYTQESIYEPIYIVDYTVSSSDDTLTDKFTLIFGKDDKLIPDIFTFIGKDLIGDVEVDVWTYSHDGVNYKYYTGGVCVLYLVEIESSRLYLKGSAIDA